MNTPKKLIYMSLLVALALILHIVEKNIPLPFTTPGAKIGFSNLITVIALYTLSRKDVIKIIVVKLLLSTIFGGNISSLLYGTMGTISSFCMMVLTQMLGKHYVSIIGASAVGAVFHNIGQIMIASIIVENPSIFLYLPVLTFVGIFTGIFIGLSSKYCITHIKQIYFLRDILKFEK